MTETREPDPARREFPPVDEQLALLRRGAVDLVSEEELTHQLERSRTTGRPTTVRAGFYSSSPDLRFGNTLFIRRMRPFRPR